MIYTLAYGTRQSTVTYTVVAWYGDVNVSQWGAGVTEAYHRDVDIGSLSDRL